jgi:hypothetical protein
MGPSVKRHPGGIGVDPHAWLMIEGSDVLDVSPSFDKVSDPQISMLREWKHVLIVANAIVPSGHFTLVTSDVDYENEIARATYATMLRTAIYRLSSVDQMDANILAKVTDVASSPFTDELMTKYSESVLIAAGRHLYDLAHGRAESLASRPQRKAWEMLAKDNRDHASWWLNRFQAQP